MELSLYQVLCLGYMEAPEIRVGWSEEGLCHWRQDNSKSNRQQQQIMTKHISYRLILRIHGAPTASNVVY